MINLSQLKESIINGTFITKQDALELVHAPLEELCACANEIRKHFCDNYFDLCTIVNGKSGNCTENCKFCAQSSAYHTGVSEYPLLESDEIIRQAKHHANKGVLRYSIVTSGRKLSNREVDIMCNTIRKLREEANISVCVSFGLLDEENYRKLKEAGASRVHNNLEASEHFFEQVCTTHTFQDKVEAIKAAKRAGLEVCSGGIMGLGETFEDRIDMAFSLRKLGVKSIPINLLNPIPGTPFAKNPLLSQQELRRIVAIYRFILPDAMIRLAGGRGLLEDKGETCFRSGANAVITGDMLTTPGYTVDSDLELINKLGYTIKLCNE